MAILEVDNKRQTLYGILLIFSSGYLVAVLSLSIQWYSEKMQYSIAEILSYISVFQLLLALISSTIKWETKLSINLKNTLISIKSINNIKHIYTRRMPPFSTTKSLLMKSHSTSYGSMTTLLSTQHLLAVLSPNNNNDHINKAQNTKKEHCKISQYFIEKITPTKIWFAILFRGVFGALAIHTFLSSQKSIGLPDTLALESFSVITSTMIGYIVLDDPFSIFHIIAILLAVIGCIMSIQPPFINVIMHNCLSGTNEWNGYLLAIISALCNGFVFLSIRIARKAPSFLLIISESVCNIITCFIMIKVYDKTEIKIWSLANMYKDVLYAALLSFILYFYSLTLTKGSQKLTVGTTNIIQTGCAIIVVFIMHAIVFSIYPNFVAVGGNFLLIISVVLVSIEKIKKAHNKSFEIFGLHKYSQYGFGDTGKDVIDPYYAFDEDVHRGSTTLIL